jgi:hypothetical protein
MIKGLMKDALLIGAGVGASVAYQKYGDKAMKKMEKVVNKTIKKVDDTLDEMM